MGLFYARTLDFRKDPANPSGKILFFCLLPTTILRRFPSDVRRKRHTIECGLQRDWADVLKGGVSGEKVFSELDMTC